MLPLVADVHFQPKVAEEAEEKTEEKKPEIPKWKDEVGDRESRLIKTMLN